MARIGNIPVNTLSLEVGKKPLVYVPVVPFIIAKAHMGRVFLNLGGRVVELDTITAHRVGLQIGRTIPKLAHDEIFILIVNGERIELLKDIASRLCAALLRKADDADDWQLNHRRKVQ